MGNDMQASGAENNPGANPWGERIQPGTPVFDAHGVSVGRVGDAGIEDGGLSVRTGGLISRDITIPLSAVRQSDAHAVILSVTKDQLAHPDASRTAEGGARGAAEDTRESGVPSPQQPRATDAGEMPPDLDAAMPPGVEANPDPNAPPIGTPDDKPLMP